MAHERILTTHVGSLIRPKELTDFLLKGQNGESYDQAAYEDCLARSVADIVRKQADIGIDIISDGEFGKNLSWSRYVLERMGGFEERHGGGVGSIRATAGKDRRDFADFYAEYEAANGFVGMGRSFAKTGLWYGAFLPVVAPASVAPERGEEYYKNSDESLMAIARALREEYKAILDAGLLLQIDDAFLATYYDVMVPPGSFADYRAWASFRIEATNEAIKGLPADRIRYHVCWGSWNGPHTNDVAAGDIMELVLKLNVGQISLEMANPRHEHEWRVWEKIKLPHGKILLPGVVTHSTNIVEHPELVAERIIRLAKLVGRENVIASTDCGFAQGPFTRRVHPSIQWAKLAALVEGADIASRELWGRAARKSVA